MLEKYLNKLEYNKILDIVSSYCATYIGKSLSSSFLPSNDKDIVVRLLDETNSAVNLLIRKGEIPLSDIENIEVCIKNLKSYNSLGAKSLLDVANVLRISRQLHQYFLMMKSLIFLSFQF